MITVDPPSKITKKQINGKIEYAAIFVVGILLRLPFMVSTVDDAFITFRYVRNIISGNGFVFNPGELILGTTTPLYTLYLAAWGKLGFDFITVGKLTNILADSASCVLLFVVVRRATNRLVAWTAVLLILSSPYNLQYSASGMETGIYTFMLLLILYLYGAKRWNWMALVGGLLVLVRPDGLLVLIVMGLFWLIDRQDLKSGMKYAALMILVTLPWILFATWYFGSPIPHSVTAKSLTYRTSVPLHWLQILWHVFAQRGGTGGALLITALLGTGIVSTLTRQALRPYLAWLLLYVGTFTFFQSGRFGWYYAPLMPLLFTFVVIGGYEWFRQMMRLPAMTTIMQSNLRTLLAGALILSYMGATGIAVSGAWQVANKEVAQEKLMWQPIGQWIQDNTMPEATVAIESIGGVGWYSERYIWDEGGLVSEKVYELNQETPGNINVFGLLQTYRPAIYIAWDPWELETRFDTPEAQTWFAANYKPVESYTAVGKTWTLFQLREE
ncbi:hypothetical protein [Candidatus Leptofilum sp.]|uniref:hypothetical protein n=1 Tax=Candidatus Leptofilum sp. TaxID=3241576 RepID=UPI003B5902CC